MLETIRALKTFPLVVNSLVNQLKAANCIDDLDPSNKVNNNTLSLVESPFGSDY